MSPPISRKLIEGHDGAYIVEGNPSIGYELHKVATTLIGSFQRSWQAVAAASEVREVAPAPPDARDPQCVAVWPECSSGDYDPRCCRFPKSCSCESRPGGDAAAEVRTAS